jgi:hypothetical protein
MHYANNVKLAPSTVELFRSTVEILAEISATLKFEPWFGSDGLDFPTSKVGVARWKALQELSVTIDKRLITKVSALETKKLINTSSVRWDAYWSPLRAEFRPSGEGSLLPTMRKIANEMKYLQAKDLGYERFETMEAKQRARRGLTRPFTGNPIEAQKELDLREYLKPVAHRLPKSAVSSQPLLEVSEEHAARLVLDPFDR